MPQDHNNNAHTLFPAANIITLIYSHVLVDRALGIFSSNKVTKEQVKDFLKGRMIKVKSDELFELIRLADILLIDELYLFCKECIKTLPLTKHNFFKILQACSLYGFYHEKNTDKYIRGNLIEFCKDKDITNIDANSVEMLLTDEELSYWPMEARFELIRDWCIAHSSTTLFERWFNFINLNKLEVEYLENVAKSNYLVQMSGKCLQSLSDHLSFREDNPVPFVFIMDDEREGSNVVGVNLEDMQLYRFNFPESLMDTVSVPRTVVTGEILAFNRSKQRVYTYDINDGICKVKRIENRDHYPLNIKHILETNKGIVIIATKGRTNVDGTSRCKQAVDSYENGSVLYQTTSDNGKVLQIEPLKSLPFEVSCACYNHSMIVMSPQIGLSPQSKLYCFSLQTNEMTKINSINLGFFERSVVKSFFPIQDKILVATSTSLEILSIDEATGVYSLEDNSNLNFTLKIRGSPRYIVLSDFLVALYGNGVLLYHKNREQNTFKDWNSCKLKAFDISNYKPITCGYVKRTKSVCHFVCPHCDPKKEEAESTHGDYCNDNQDDDDHSDTISEEYYNYTSDGSDEPCW